MAGEIITTVPGEPNVGGLLNINRTLSNAAGVMAMMLIILVIGIVVDALLFSTLERAVARGWGVSGPAA